MSKYLRLFETVADYTAAENTLVKPNVSLIEETNKVEYNPYIPLRNDIIKYTASSKLDETTSLNGNGLHTNAFNTTIKSHTFENGVGTIEFNDNVTTIGGSAFYKCTNLESITIPNSVTSIGQSTFERCANLTSITIPNSVTSIGGYAFVICSSLISITIPDSVTSIGTCAFNRCSSLVSVTVESTTPPTLGFEYGRYGQFTDNASGRKIYVPAESVDTYKSASGWSTYASDIEAIPT